MRGVELLSAARRREDLRDSPDGRLKTADAIDALGVASMLSNDLVQYDGYRTSLGA